MKVKVPVPWILWDIDLQHAWNLEVSFGFTTNDRKCRVPQTKVSNDQSPAYV